MNKYKVYKYWPFYTTVKANSVYIHTDGSLNFNAVRSEDNIQAVATFTAPEWKYYKVVD